MKGGEIKTDRGSGSAYPGIRILLSVALISITIISCGGEKRQSGGKELKGFETISDDSLLTLVQYRTFQYFWDGAEPVSGMARERFHVDGIYPQNDQNIVATGGSGFGIMAILVGIERGFIKREEGLLRLNQIVDFLERADRYHGAWSHWIDGETARTKPFSPKDNGADIVETAFLVQGLLTAKQYFIDGTDQERMLAMAIDTLWREIDWSWFTKGGENVLYWHWSPDYNWEMNLQVRGWDECLILYILAASSPTNPVPAEVYHEGWARGGDIVSDNEKYGFPLIVKHNFAEEYGGPLFWSHYSFVGLDPRNLEDTYANYWQVNRNHTLINRSWCIENANEFLGYGEDCWGLTSSYSPSGYSAHAPGAKRDIGVITPSAALSAFPYTPEYSTMALNNFYYTLGDRIFGIYGFYAAFSIQEEWFPQKYLAIDQGPIIAMIENYRTGLLWEYFMRNPEIQTGLRKLGFKTW
jgi:hypothetical protein